MVGDIVRNLWFLGTGYLMKRNTTVTNFKQQVGLGNSYCNYLFSINLSKNKYYGNCCFCCQNICVVSICRSDKQCYRKTLSWESFFYLF